jgi:hypothetical protein
VRISPDGTQVAAEIYDPQLSETDSDIWLYDMYAGSKHVLRQSQERLEGLAGRPTGSTLFLAQIGGVTSISMKNPPMDLERKCFCTSRRLESIAKVGRRTASHYSL